ncbi:curli-like amyloid fiber formation chaperone CsgH [Cupriavidus sp. CV2]|uniref:curli-like amyloid fiber formation chaperone CsgH n=1 Tax=Cupriavidus ulmosensis TaxID=3065913 RepID=UPI00296A95CB|nr:curli-like amyloid fiber formation chaperone CsgH [Cupriavidus sp. CV2]MDW3684625.1 curli-like amyloid fiber formation chaperone CsgH [Cupriavidus sp. CV2]
MIDFTLALQLHPMHNNGHTLVAPDISSAREVGLQYDLKLLNTGQAGMSSMSQSGNASMEAGEPKRASSEQVTPHPGGKCEAELTLHDGRLLVGQYFLDCSAK